MVWVHLSSHKHPAASAQSHRGERVLAALRFCLAWPYVKETDEVCPGSFLLWLFQHISSRLQIIYAVNVNGVFSYLIRSQILSWIFTSLYTFFLIVTILVIDNTHTHTYTYIIFQAENQLASKILDILHKTLCACSLGFGRSILKGISFEHFFFSVQQYTLRMSVTK